MDTDSEDEPSYTTQYQEAFLKYVENEYWAKHQLLPIIQPGSVPNNNLISSAMSSRTGQSSYDPYDLASDDTEYRIPKDVAETMPGRIVRVACTFTAARLYFDSPLEFPLNWGQINMNCDGYHSGPMDISSTFWIPDITDWWHHQEETHSKYANLFNVVSNIFSIMPHGIGVDTSSSLGRDVIGRRQSITTGQTLHDKVVRRQFARVNNGILVADDLALDTTNTENDLEMQRQAE